MLLHHLFPRTEFVFDRKELGGGEAVLERIHGLLIVHSVVKGGDDLTGLRTVEVIQIGLSRLKRALGLNNLVDPGNRELRKNVGFRHHNNIVLVFIEITNVVDL